MIKRTLAVPSAKIGRRNCAAAKSQESRLTGLPAELVCRSSHLHAQP
jgi:hypothetical protein